MNADRNGMDMVTNTDGDNAAKSPEIVERMAEARRLFYNLQMTFEQQPTLIMASLPRGYSWNMFEADIYGFVSTVTSPTFHETLPAIEAWLNKVYPGRQS